MPRKLMLSNAAAAIELYRQLCAPNKFVYKTRVRVYPSAAKNSHAYQDVAIHDDPENLRLSQFRRANPRRVEPVYEVDCEGQKRLCQTRELTGGALYFPQGINQNFKADLEWLLVFKCDVDLALAKGKSIGQAVAPYVDGLQLAISEKLARAQKKLKETAGNDNGGRPQKSNSEDLMERFGEDDEAREWINRNANELDAGNFSRDDYRSQIERNSVSIQETEFNRSGRKRPPKINY